LWGVRKNDPVKMWHEIEGWKKETGEGETWGDKIKFQKGKFGELVPKSWRARGIGGEKLEEKGESNPFCVGLPRSGERLDRKVESETPNID